MQTPSDERHDAGEEKAARAARCALSNGEKWALRATILCGVLLVITLPVFQLVALYRSAVPNIIIPSPAPLPEPNAFDVYVKATMMVSAVYTKAAPPGSPLGSVIVKPPSAVYKEDAPLSLLERTTKDYAPALRVLRSGFVFAYSSPPPRSAAMSFSPFSRFREMSHILSVESRALAARKNWNGAMESHLDGIRFGSDIPRGSNFTSALQGVVCQMIARKDADKIVPYLNAQQARSAAKRLEAIYANRVSPAEIFVEEKWFGLALLKETFTDPNWREKLRSDVIHSAEERMSLSKKWQYWRLDASTVTKNYTVFMDTVIANARLPYYVPKKPLPQDLDIYTSETTFFFERTDFHFARNDAGNVLLLTALALRAFQAEKGRLPQSLKELAPSYLSRIPLDPFGRGEALRFVRKSAREYSLYSLGPDGKDNGGQAAKPSLQPLQPNPRGSHFIDEWSRGDMVLGINS